MGISSELHPQKQTWNVNMDQWKIGDVGFGNHCCPSLLSRNILYNHTEIYVYIYNIHIIHMRYEYLFCWENFKIYKNDLAPDLTINDEQVQVRLPIAS